MNNLNEKLRNFFRYHIINYPWTYNIYIILMVLLNPKIFFYLLKSKKKILSILKNKNYTQLKRDGFLKLDIKTIDLDEKYCESLNHELKRGIDISESKTNLKPIYKLKETEELLKNENVVNFLTQKQIINLLTLYIGSTPQLINAHIWYSPNIKDFQRSTQYFHSDHEDRKQIKLFFYLDDIKEDSGPLEIINKKESDQIRNKISYRLQEKKTTRISDEIIPENKILKCTGKKNSIYLVDTTNILHRGSRVANKPRLLFMAQYVSLFTTTKNKEFKDNNGNLLQNGKSISLIKTLKKYQSFKDNKVIFNSILQI